MSIESVRETLARTVKKKMFISMEDGTHQRLSARTFELHGSDFLHIATDDKHGIFEYGTGVCVSESNFLDVALDPLSDIVKSSFFNFLKSGSHPSYPIHNGKDNFCPSCELVQLHPIEVRNALSRKDNKTYICDSCGSKEAFEGIER